MCIPKMTKARNDIKDKFKYCLKQIVIRASSSSGSSTPESRGRADARGSSHEREIDHWEEVAVQHQRILEEILTESGMFGGEYVERKRANAKRSVNPNVESDESGYVFDPTYAPRNL